MNLPDLSIDNFFYLKPLHLTECGGVAFICLVESLFNSVNRQGIRSYPDGVKQPSITRELSVKLAPSFSRSCEADRFVIKLGEPFNSPGIQISGDFSGPCRSEAFSLKDYLLRQFWISTLLLWQLSQFTEAEVV